MAFKIHSVGKFKITPGYDYKLCLLKFMTLKGISFPFFKLQFPQSVNPLHTNLQITRVPLRGEGSCGGVGAPRDSAA